MRAIRHPIAETGVPATVPSQTVPNQTVPSQAVQPIVALLSDEPGGNPTQYVVEKAFAHHQLDWRYLTFEVTAENLGDAIGGLRAMGFRGGHCGDCHKQAVIPLLDRTTKTAALAEAVNLIAREDDQLVGHNTEGMGFVESLRRVADPGEMRVLLWGAGRVARAIGIELASAGVGAICVVNRTAGRARQLAELLVGNFSTAATTLAWESEFEIPSNTNLLINATSLGREDPEARLPLNPESLSCELTVADVTIQPPQTWLLREADHRGCTTLDGLGMYIDRVAVDLKMWTGVDPDRGVMREAVEEFLEL